METEKIGLEYTSLLSYNAINDSNKSDDEKRNLLFSVYSFRCLFDNNQMTSIHPILEKYACTFYCKLHEHPYYNDDRKYFEQVALEKPMYIDYGGLYIEHEGEYVVRYDAGSPIWQTLSKRGKLSGIASTVPQKKELYDMVLDIVSLETATDELKAMWYMMFLYVILIEAKHDEQVFDQLYEILANEEVFKKVISLRYSLYIPDSMDEMHANDMSNTAVVWLMPYVDWKNEVNDKGVSREVERFRLWLTEGRFSDVYSGTEKLLDTFPDDEELLLTNIASRISLDKSIPQKDKNYLLNDTIDLIESALETPKQKRIFFLYYSGLAFLGLKNSEAAQNKFLECLDINPKFEPALLMVKALSTN